MALPTTSRHIYEFRDYREFIRVKMQERIARNPRYTLRAFARDLHLSPQVLSMVLNRHRGISNETAARVGERLGLSVREIAYLMDLVSLDSAKDGTERSVLEYRLTQWLDQAFAPIPEAIVSSA